MAPILVCGPTFNGSSEAFPEQVGEGLMKFHPQPAAIGNYYGLGLGVIGFLQACVYYTLVDDVEHIHMQASLSELSEVFII